MGAGFQGSAETPRQTTSYLTGLTHLSLCHTGTQGALGLFTARLAHILLATHAVTHIAPLKEISDAELMCCVFTQTDAFDKQMELARRGKQHIYYFL